MINLIYLIAHKIGINSILLLSIIQVETGMRNVNNYNDTYYTSYGYAQIQLKTARSIYPFVDAVALQIPEVNITISALYLKSLQIRYGNNVHKIISAYNAGHFTPNNKNYVDLVESKCYFFSKRECKL